jgi:hypothetical protein
MLTIYLVDRDTYKELVFEKRASSLIVHGEDDGRLGSNDEVEGVIKSRCLEDTANSYFVKELMNA